MYVADEIGFDEFCTLCERLSASRKNQTLQTSILTEYIHSFRQKCSSAGPEYKKSFFPVLRLLVPECDRERSAFGLKEYSLGRHYVKLLGLHMSSHDAQKLTNFKSVQGQQGSDFASILFCILRTRTNKSGSLTIGEINAALDRMSSAETGAKSHVLNHELGQLLGTTTPKQHEWLVRIILKDVKLGMGSKRVLTCLHPDAPEIFDNCSSLLKVCEELEDVNTRPAEIGVQLFLAVSPMLAERLDVKDIPKLPAHTTYQIEQKFDGERFQIHMKDNVFRYFSRRGHDYTPKFGATFDADGILTPLLRNCFSAQVESFVLDGEMMGWHKKFKCFGSKGMRYDVKKMTENSSYRPCFCAFDILYYNGKSLSGEDESRGGMRLASRLQILDQLFGDVEGVILKSDRLIASEKSHIIKALNEAIDKNEEGIVVKDVDSFYVANRRNAGWHKIKPEYTEGAIEDLDLMVIGAFYAENKRSGLVNSFLVAVGEPSETPGEMPKRWLSVGRVGTGLSMEERETLWAKMEHKWRVASKDHQPQGHVWGKIKPDLWVRPEDSVILQVKASELAQSDVFAAGYVLRFPRIIRIRDDKPVQDAMTTSEFFALTQGKAVEKLHADHFSVEDILSASSSSSDRQRRKRPAKVLQVPEQFRKTANPENVVVCSAALSGRKICVLSGDEDCSKGDLEATVMAHGGVVVQNSGRDTWCAIAGRVIPRVKNALDDPKVNVTSAKWLRDLPNSTEPAALPSPLYMLAMTEDTKAKLKTSYDEYGDSYTVPLNEETLKDILKSMEEKSQKHPLSTESMSSLDRDLFDGQSPYSFLRDCHICFIEENPRLEAKASFYSASICDIESPLLTHVVCKAVGTLVTKVNVFVVRENWLVDSFDAKVKLDEIDYLVK